MTQKGLTFASIVVGLVALSGLSMSGLAVNTELTTGHSILPESGSEQGETIRCTGALLDDEATTTIRRGCNDTGDGLWISNEPVVLSVSAHNGIMINLTYAGGTPSEACLPGDLGCEDVPDTEINEFMYRVRIYDSEKGFSDATQLTSRELSGADLHERSIDEGAGTYEVTLEGLEGDTAYDLILTPY